MLFNGPQIGAALALAATSSAFLLPPPIITAIDKLQDSPKSEPFPNIATVPHELFNERTYRMHDLDCPGCGSATEKDEEGHWIWQEGTDSVMILELRSDFNTVQLNGEDVFPIHPTFMPLVSLVKENASEGFANTVLRQPHPTKTITQSHASFAESFPDAEGNVVITINMGIDRLGDQPVHVENLLIKLVRTATGQLLIHTFESGPATFPMPVDEAPSECHNLPPLLCKWRNIMAGKLAGFRDSLKAGCHGKGMDGRIDGPDGKALEGGHRHLHSHHRPHHRHGLLHTIPRRILNVLIPMLIGITAGMAASLIGMLVGNLVAFLWIKYRRGGRRGNAGYIVVEDLEEVDAAGDEENLPAYAEKATYTDEPAVEAEVPEDPPAYAEADNKTSPAEMP